MKTVQILPVLQIIVLGIVLVISLYIAVEIFFLQMHVADRYFLVVVMELVVIYEISNDELP
jgi:hypothetical protein